ncbi:MAG: NADH-quinone oxidoreductase [Chloroflexaceae bacterium]|nr:NADH-quinone oxidoreductase [Chloroflexaceae bacterium]NJL33116.1 NADH-quinone oxidoreductase [Chloroflexaceae bacterium]NJO04109.1 NADH-quinone oxidoreductase [Chloroflexaceae bacterium]
MLQETYATEIERLLSRYADRRSAVLPLLYIAQDHYGPLKPAVIQEVADILHLPYTNVFEVVGFYTLFYDQPFGRWMVQVCDDVPCCYLGAEALISALKQKLNLVENQTSADNMFTLQRVKCLAACDRAPVVQANLSYIYDVTARYADALISMLREMADSNEALSVSGRLAEDFEPDGAGGFRRIERLLAPYQAPTNGTAAGQPQAGEATATEQVAPAVAAESKEEAAEAIATESPVEPSPDRTPASAHPAPEQAEERSAVPPVPAQQEPPQATTAEETPPATSNQTEEGKH